MNVVRYTPSINRDRDFFDTMFSDFFAPFTMVDNENPQQQTSPKVDIYEKENCIHIDAELPGVNKEDISVDIKGKFLTLSGERKKDETVEKKDLYRRECRYGAFKRSFTLPFEVKNENIEARFDNGILKLTITRPKEEESTRIIIS